QTAVGPLPPFIGRRGLGKQCSMAHHRQDPRDPADQSESQPGIIRGSLPLELRECQKDGLLGTLIMGPAGEIICLSFWDSLTDTEDHPALEDAMKEHGVLESWTILDQLAEQATQTVVNTPHLVVFCNSEVSRPEKRDLLPGQGLIPAQESV
ncbi:uncharacterized protein LOC113654540 isoform X1, partial [Tachysurus ichikawai]